MCLENLAGFLDKDHIGFGRLYEGLILGGHGRRTSDEPFVVLQERALGFVEQSLQLSQGFVEAFDQVTKRLDLLFSKLQDPVVDVLISLSTG